MSTENLHLHSAPNRAPNHVETPTLKHICYDLETLATGDGAAIIQIGAVRFDPWYTIEGQETPGMISTPEGEFRVNVEFSEDSGDVDAGTVAWWLNQDHQTRQRVLAAEERVPLKLALLSFLHWIGQQGPVDHVWSCGMDFDERLVRQHCGRLGLRWPFRKEHRDFRTLRAIGRSLGVEEPEFVGVKHDALDDAYHEAGYAILVMQKLGAFRHE